MSTSTEDYNSSSSNALMRENFREPRESFAVIELRESSATLELQFLSTYADKTVW